MHRLEAFPVRRALVPARWVSAAVLAILLLSPYCNASFRFTHSAEECTAVGEDSLVIVVQTESGTARSYVGPCPKTRSTVEEVRYYTLTYKLSRPQDRPVKSACLRFPAKDVQGPPEGNTNPAVDQILNRLEVPPAAHLYCRRNKRIRDVEGNVPANDQATLQRLGFDTTRAVYLADMPDGRWYMGFHPCENGIQICCPAKGLLVKKDLKCDYGSIWDPERSRVIVLTTETTPFVGFPKEVTAWNYVRNTVTIYKPWQPPSSDFR